MNKMRWIKLLSPGEEGGGSTDDLLKDLTADVPAEPAEPTETKEPAEPKETKESTETKETKEPKESKETKESTSDNEDDDDEKTKGIKSLRENYEKQKKQTKELEEAKKKLEEESKIKTDKLIKAIKLGIKGETEEEILLNLQEHELKEEAERSGLTEEQIRKDQELSQKMEKLSKEQQELLFNRRAFDLQQELNLTTEETLKFVEECGNLGINLFTTTASFKDIYNRLYNSEPQNILAEKEKEIEELKKEIKELKKEKAPGRSPSGDTGEKATTLDSLLNELTNKGGV